ncbi:reverse transcriptase domain-containing protein [Limnohabitans sp.]|uniref:reverse transcriptase domain-containing protein n=1 Tax=Limnohabitans sp. TaxID=1907725 RepID=UPI003A4E1131
MKDVLNYAEKDGWATISDYKAGYHHISCPALSQYLGVCWQGTVYVWTCMPFGFAPACRIFTEVNNVMYRPVREARVNLTTYIDDRLSASANRE